MKFAAALLFFALLAGQAKALDVFKAAGIDRMNGVAVPLDLSFQDESGRRATFRDLAAGKPILLIPVLHRCPNICGMTLAGLAEAIQASGLRPDRDFALIAFGIDPQEPVEAAAETIAQLKKAFPDLAAAAVHATVGAPGNVQSVAAALGYRYAYDPDIAQYAHVAAVAVLTADGRLVHWLYGISPDPMDLRLALTEAGEGQIGGWGDQLLLLCYHYDPVTGRYGALIWTSLRVGGGLTLLALAGFIGIAVLRELKPRSGAPTAS